MKEAVLTIIDAWNGLSDMLNRFHNLKGIGIVRPVRHERR
jgi:hypothetical protein